MVFEERGRPEYMKKKKPLQGTKERTNNKLNPSTNFFEHVTLLLYDLLEWGT